MQQEFYAHGKLLITGEYLILQGAMGLAMPTRFGQRMFVEQSDNSEHSIHWKSFTETNTLWLDVQFNANDLQVKTSTAGTKEEISLLQQILRQVRTQNPEYLKGQGAVTINNHLEFPRDWGLGSSSTLLFNIARHAKVDAFALNAAIFKGSGYDIACAGAKWPILYKLDDEGSVYDTVHFMPPAPEQLLFVHLGNKQNSRVAVDAFMAQGKAYTEEIETISEISEALLFCDDPADFIQLLDEHEEVMQYVLQEEKIKSARFSDFPGSIKSLGAWGGDFILAAADMDNADLKKYFTTKGYNVHLDYLDMMLK